MTMLSILRKRQRLYSNRNVHNHYKHIPAEHSRQLHSADDRLWIRHLYGIGGVAIGMTIGGYVFRHLSNKVFKHVVYAYIGISGLIILLTV